MTFPTTSPCSPRKRYKNLSACMRDLIEESIRTIYNRHGAWSWQFREDSLEFICEELSEYKNEYHWNTYNITFDKQFPIIRYRLRSFIETRKKRETEQLDKLFHILYKHAEVNLCDGSFDRELTVTKETKPLAEFINYNLEKYNENESYSHYMFNENHYRLIDLIPARIKESRTNVINNLKERIKINPGLTKRELFYNNR